MVLGVHNSKAYQQFEPIFHWVQIKYAQRGDGTHPRKRVVFVGQVGGQEAVATHGKAVSPAVRADKRSAGKRIDADKLAGRACHPHQGVGLHAQRTADAKATGAGWV